MAELPEAYCYFQEIEPRSPFQLAFDRDYLLHAVRGALDIRIGSGRWLLPRSYAAWVPAHTLIDVTISRPVTSCSILAVPGVGKRFPDHPVVFQMSALTRAMVAHCRQWGIETAHTEQAGVFFRALLDTCAGLVGTATDVVRPSCDDPGLQRAIAFAEEHLGESLEAPAVARAAGLSERTMNRRCLAELGESWSQTLTRIRMLHAIELVAEGDRKIIEVSMDCGFTSLSAFNRAFKDFTGTTPSALRKRVCCDRHRSDRALSALASKLQVSGSCANFRNGPRADPSIGTRSRRGDRLVGARGRG